MKDLIPLFRIDLIKNWEAEKEKVWRDAEDYYEKLLIEMKKDLGHMVYVCSPLKSTVQKTIQAHIKEAIEAASQILGGVIEHNRKKIFVWIPHLHLFSIYNEIIYPQTREKAIKFNNLLLQKYFHTLVVVGDIISGGMAAEIELARRKGLKVVKMEDFKKQLKNLPDSRKSKINYRKMVSLYNKMHGSKFWIEK